MAKISSSARPLSRQGSAAPKAVTATAPTRSTRATRSQSREPEDVQVEVAAKKRGRKAQKDLDTVAEDAINEDELQATAQAAEREAALFEEQEADDAAAEVRRQSGQSGFSGTTAKTSFSQEEIAGLDSDMMIDVLPDLVKAADQMSELLVHSDPKARPFFWKEIRTRGTRHSKLYSNRLDSLEVHKKHFGSQVYVYPSFVARALMGVQAAHEVPEGLWRPDNLIYKVNLAQLLRAVLVPALDLSERRQEQYDSLELLDSHFAQCIAGPLPDMKGALLLLQIQAQLTIVRLADFQDAPQFDPMDVITDSFFKRDVEGNLAYKDAESMHISDLGDEDEQTFNELLDRIVEADFRAPISEGLDFPTTLTQLRDRFTWAHFIDHVVAYYEHRSAQLDAHIASAGGPDGIVKLIEREVERRKNARMADKKRQSIGKTGGTPVKAYGKSAAARLAALEKRMSIAKAPHQDAAPAETLQAQSVDPQLIDDHEDEDGAPEDHRAPSLDSEPVQPRPASGLDLTGFRRTQMQNAKKAKASFLDRQPDAVRIDFDDDDDEPSQQALPARGVTSRGAGGSSATRPFQISSSSAKRPFSHEDEPQLFDPTQDGGFQVDTRDTAAADARRAAVPRQVVQPRSQAPPAVRSNTVDYELPASAGPSPSKRRKTVERKNPGSTIPPPLAPLDPEEGEPSPGQRYERIKALAKQGRIAPTQIKPPKARRPWTHDEEAALLSLIERHGGDGVSYSTLKRYDESENNVLEHRSAEDMRFKARNMKYDMICARVPMPDHWDKVLLDRKLMIKVQSRGITYEQNQVRQINAETPGI
ncbi:hypothetical protein LTR56_005739 [Elasticomyces elasticus]|nr:hypothetical protein LTR56_005739 [Elasticomyces elasticus]KAK3657464.1 hypothetical protein LTR22_009330 [Elasticomyces elasticus]KAK4925669.1 hypothetical protein LTR49_007279 [Elasticomyces elasticus]KAK5765001.1 hypothetical protein LTS12_004779 [Elasticomyces elasticus]